MTRIVLGCLTAAILLLLPATALGDSGVHARGAVAAKNVSTHLVTLRSAKRVVGLRVPGSLAAIHVGQRVELRGSTLRTSGRAAHVLARNVTIAGSKARAAATPTSGAGDDEVEITGKLLSLAPVTVESATRTVSCEVPAGMALTGVAVGDLVEITCDLKGGAWVLRKLEREDHADDDEADDDSGANSGPGSVDDQDDDDHSGPGGGDDDDHDEDDDHGGSSGPGGGGDD